MSEEAPVLHPALLASQAGENTKSLLAYPMKIRKHPKRSLMMISDTGHHRILIVSEDGDVIDVIGSGRKGASDGAFEDVEFNFPQGTFAQGDFIYIADTANHLIREANLKTRRVRTLLGSGAQGSASILGGKGSFVDLNFPWDLVILGNKLYFTMSGAHQVWLMDLLTRECALFAGSSISGNQDGALLTSLFSTPTGITSDGVKLYVTDSANGSIRSIELELDGKVETLTPSFEISEDEEDAQPMDLIVDQKLIFFVDAKLDHVKKLDLTSGKLEILAGSNHAGYLDGDFDESRFSAPTGITLFDREIFIADSLNHMIRKLNLRLNTVETFAFKNLEPVALRTMNANTARVVKLESLEAQPGRGVLTLDIKLPEEYRLTSNAPFHLKWKTENDEVLKFLVQGKSLEVQQLAIPLALPWEAYEGATRIKFEMVVYYCRADSSLCLFDHVAVELPIVVSAAGKKQLNISVPVNVRQGTGA